MKTLDDTMLEAPAFQQAGVELILRVLRESKKPVHVLSFGSARAIAVAFNRDPDLCRKKIKLIYLSAGMSNYDQDFEHNVKLRDDGMFYWQPAERAATKKWIYYRGDAVENEKALQDALPALYTSFNPDAQTAPTGAPLGPARSSSASSVKSP